MEVILQQVQKDILELKNDVKGLFKILSKQEGIIEAVNAIRADVNRIHKSHTELFNRIREIEDTRVKKEDCKTEKYVTRRELATWLTMMGFFLTILVFISRSTGGP